MQTVVVGNPFDLPKAAFDDHVRSLMHGQNRGVPAEFVEGQTERTSPLYKVVVGFNLTGAVSFSQMCRSPAGLPIRPKSGRIDVAIVFCRGDEAMSGTTGRADNVAGPTDPRFSRLVRFATLYMLSDYDYRRDRSIGVRSWLP